MPARSSTIFPPSKNCAIRYFIQYLLYMYVQDVLVLFPIITSSQLIVHIPQTTCTVKVYSGDDHEFDRMGIFMSFSHTKVKTSPLCAINIIVCHTSLTSLKWWNMCK